jgi:hypothetical protein
MARISNNNLLNIMPVFIFSTTFVWSTSHFTMKRARYYHKCIHVWHLIFMSDVNKTWLFLDNFLNQPQIVKLHENPSSGTRVLPCGRTDGHDEAKSRPSQLCARALQPQTHVCWYSSAAVRGGVWNRHREAGRSTRVEAMSSTRVEEMRSPRGRCNEKSKG